METEGRTLTLALVAALSLESCGPVEAQDPSAWRDPSHIECRS